MHYRGKVKIRLIMKNRKGSVWITMLVCVVVVFGIYFFSGDFVSEKMSAATSVIKKRTEDKIVDAAGKHKVAEEIALQRIESLRAKLIEIKSIRRFIDRKRNSPGINQERAAKYAKLSDHLESVEKKSELAYNDAKDRFEKLCIELDSLETETQIVRASSQILTKTSAKKFGRDELDSVLESIIKDLDTAHAELDMAIIDSEEG